MRGWTRAAALRQSLKGVTVKRSKFGNVKTTIHGITFDSKREAKRWTELRLRERAGFLTDLKHHPEPWALHCPTPGDDVVVCFYEPDFEYREAGALVIEDSKGVRTQIYRLKKKWMKLEYGITIRET